MGRRKKRLLPTIKEDCCKCHKTALVGPDIMPVYAKKKIFWVCYDCRQTELARMRDAGKNIR